jgi:hypothetical protein
LITEVASAKAKAGQKDTRQLACQNDFQNTLGIPSHRAPQKPRRRRLVVI